MATIFYTLRDINGLNTYVIPISDLNYSSTLDQNVEATLLIPSQFPQYAAIFSIEPGSMVWVAVNGTAAVPAGNSLAATTSVLNPTARILNAGDTLHVITSDTTADFSVALYAIPAQQ